MEKDKKKQMIKLCLAVSSLIFILIIVIAIMIKYEVEGDKNMPFNLSKIMIVSTAEGVATEGKNKWNFNMYQNNDVYFYIDKNEKYNGKTKFINSIKIENIKILESPEVGKVETYMPNSIKGRLYSYEKEYIVDNSLEYRGGAKSNPQTLEIGNQGGNVLVRFSNTNIGKYSSDKDTQIVHDGTLLNKANLTNEQIKFKISFDFIMNVTNSVYKANIVLELPSGNILENGTESIEKTDMNDIIFKRIK